tara:strand:- start:607 stop:915 length:309 start_codon:yes stop_codon:yes gene_type:complete
LIFNFAMKDPVERKAVVPIWCSHCGGRINKGHKLFFESGRGSPGLPGAVVYCNSCYLMSIGKKKRPRLSRLTIADMPDSPSEPEVAEEPPSGRLITREGTEW